MADITIKNPPGYEIKEYIDGGSMGEVYRAVQISLDREVAIKTRIISSLDKEEMDPERLIREAKTIARLEHPKIIKVHDCFVRDERIYIVMELLNGTTLGHILSEKENWKQYDRYLRAPGKLELEWILKIGIEVSMALQHAHEKDIYHRDIKPSNIFITNNDEIKVFDFSIARDIKSRGLTMTGMIVGSPPYMSPEQVQGKKIDSRSDIYSMGCVLFHAVTGSMPFHDTSEIMICVKHLQEAPPDPKEIAQDCPEELREIILKCLEKKPEDRYQSAKDLAEDLMDLSEKTGKTDLIDEDQKKSVKRKIARSHQKKAMMVLLPLLILSLGFAAYYYSTRWSSIATFVNKYQAELAGLNNSNPPNQVESSVPLNNPEKSLMPAIPTFSATPTPSPEISPTPAPPEKNENFPESPFPEVDKLERKWKQFCEWERESIRENIECGSSIFLENFISWNNGSIQLRLINYTNQPVNVSYLVIDGEIEYYYIDENWNLNKKTLDLTGNGEGACFGEQNAIHAPFSMGQYSKTPLHISNVIQPDIVYADVILNDIRICGRGLFPNESLTTPPLVSLTTTNKFATHNRLEKPVSLTYRPEKLDQIFKDRVKAPPLSDTRLKTCNKEQILQNIQGFYENLMTFSENGCVRTELTDFMDKKATLTGNDVCHIFFRINTSKDIRFHFLIIDGYQKLHCKEGKSFPLKTKTLVRPLNGLYLENVRVPLDKDGTMKITLTSPADALAENVTTLLDIKVKEIVINKAFYFAVTKESGPSKGFQHRSIEDILICSD